MKTAKQPATHYTSEAHPYSKTSGPGAIKTTSNGWIFSTNYDYSQYNRNHTQASSLLRHRRLVPTFFFLLLFLFVCVRFSHNWRDGFI